MRIRIALALAALATAATLLQPGAARADLVPATSGTLTMTSDPGDWLGGGQSYSFATPDASFLTHGDALYFDGNYVRVWMNAPNDWWDLEFQAPTGQRLASGVTYSGAVRGPQSSPPPGDLPRMDVFGDGRGCNTLVGSFTVHDVVYGPYGYLQRLHVSFEDHCEGADPALRGELDVTAPPAPPAQDVHVTVEPGGVVVRPGGGAFVHGTISCAVPYSAYVDVSVNEQTKKGVVSGTAWSVPVDCPGPTPTAWSATVRSDSGASFAAGSAQVTASTGAFDATYTQYLGQNPVYVYASQTANVQLVVR